MFFLSCFEFGLDALQCLTWNHGFLSTLLRKEHGCLLKVIGSNSPPARLVKSGLAASL